MMNETNADSCYSNDDAVFCNGAAPFHILMKMKQRSYNHNRDCVHDYSYAFSTPPPGMCVFSPQDIEAWEQEGDKDIHTSDYEEEDVE